MVDFVKLLEANDTKALKDKIEDLKQDLTSETEAWEESLVSLFEGLVTYFSLSAFQAIAESLPQAQFDALIARLFASHQCPKALVSAWLGVIEDERQLFSPSIASKLLNSSLEIDSDNLRQLVSLMPPQDLSACVMEMFLARPSIARGKHTKKNKSLMMKWDTLLTTLCIHLNNSTQGVPSWLENNRMLANLMAVYRLEYGGDKELLSVLKNIFVHHSLYDWSDPAMLEKIYHFLQHQLSSLDISQAVSLYKEFIASRLEPFKRMAFLDRFYAKNPCGEAIYNACVDTECATDSNFVINYLSRCQLKKPQVMNYLLRKIPEDMHISLVGHIYLLSTHNSYDFEWFDLFKNYIHVLYEGLSDKASRQRFSDELVESTKTYPDDVRLTIVTQIYRHFNSDADIQWDWLLTVCQHSTVELTVLTLCANHLLKHQLPVDSQNLLLRTLKPENIIQLFKLLVKHDPPERVFDVFKLYYKTHAHQSILYLLLTKIPTIPAHFLQAVLSQVEDKLFITLVENLLSKTKEDSGFLETLDQVLLQFCVRLNLRKDTLKWQDEIFASSLAQKLLLSPDCIFSLVNANRPIYSILTGKNADHPIYKVLDQSLLSDDVMESVALNLLIRFRDDRKKLKHIFTFLKDIPQTEFAILKTNHRHLKESCWKILKGNTPYQDEQFTALIDGLVIGNTFDPALTKKAQAASSSENPAQGAKWLSMIQNMDSLNYSHQTMVSLLVHSLHEDTIGNWDKIQIKLEGQGAQENVAFIQCLMKKVLDKKDNPVLVLKAHYLISNNSHLKEVLASLDKEQFYWLMASCPQELLKKVAVQWFNWYLSGKNPDPLEMAQCLLLLPNEKQLMEGIYTLKSVDTPGFMAKFCQVLATREDMVSLLRHFHRFTCAKDNKWKKEYVRSFVRNMQLNNIKSTAILHSFGQVINSMYKAFSFNNFEDKQLAQDIFRFLGDYLRLPDIDHPEAWPFVTNCLIFFREEDYSWLNYLFKTTTYTNVFLFWLSTLNLDKLSDEIHRSVFFRIYLENTLAEIQPELTNHATFKNFILHLLKLPKIISKIDSFLALFKYLDKDEQQELVLSILNNNPRETFQNTILPHLADTLSIDHLFKTWEKSHQDFVVLCMLTQHHSGLSDFSLVQKKQLVESINKSDQITQMLHGFSTKKNKEGVVALLFDSCEGNVEQLAQAMASWEVNAESLASIANFTCREQDKKLFKALIQSKPHYRKFIDSYIESPSLDMQVIKDSFLYDVIQDVILNPLKGCLADPQFFKAFSPSIVLAALKQQFSLVKNGQPIFSILNSLEGQDLLEEGVLSTLRFWLQLSLINDGFFQTLAHLPKAQKDVRSVIKKSKLYSFFLDHPLDTERRFNLKYQPQLPQWIEDLSRDLQAVDKALSKEVRVCLTTYQRKVEIAKRHILNHSDLLMTTTHSSEIRHYFGKNIHSYKAPPQHIYQKLKNQFNALLLKSMSVAAQFNDANLIQWIFNYRVKVAVIERSERQ